MNNIILGIIAGLVFGVIDVLVMAPLKFEDKRKKIEAMTGAFIERFMLGFLIPNVNLGIHPAIIGVLLGIGLSVPTAIITRTYAPIVGIGAVGGIIIGFITKAMLGG
ncbi:hypothetical protein AUJ66_03825 [Candidatus Desantisbacteria bacterium CG1_02_38_46]|uniref:Uncharacterized protein n=3 Tax=unclassified Candidatus Desantisiibacteriota TaxID=3106372 RepID=A0A2H9PCL1_9BACT|nr:MAG: hypothetical protein AUJ66_03825 [Candidatus Desantisbacteria bacterium CG1_02_38_46]PIU51560.1 MAG: hypothetical protein COS91_03810 [Candidatus Desantisbacteria bacterium CG07_land_8_20_14_0_80_39_15]PIZ17026.1 MAG: hypothetical protein COY51_01365 [Candidatus Desantisbacteria bacterium CG_4_10_14_0_8_um_filter_39_17]